MWQRLGEEVLGSRAGQRHEVDVVPVRIAATRIEERGEAVRLLVILGVQQVQATGLPGAREHRVDEHVPADRVPRGASGEPELRQQRSRARVADEDDRVGRRCGGKLASSVRDVRGGVGRPVITAHVDHEVR